MLLLPIIFWGTACSTKSLVGNWKSVEVWDGEKWMRPTGENDYIIIGFDSSQAGFSKTSNFPRKVFNYTDVTDKTPPEIIFRDVGNNEVWQYKIQGEHLILLLYSNNSKGVVVNPDFEKPPKEVSKAIRFIKFTGQVE